MEQHPSVEGDGRRAIQEIPHLLWDPKIHYHKPNVGPSLGSDKSITHTHTHTHSLSLSLSLSLSYLLTLLLILTSYLCLPGLFLRGFQRKYMHLRGGTAENAKPFRRESRSPG